jgi:hypothetical protein
MDDQNSGTSGVFVDEIGPFSVHPMLMCFLMGIGMQFNEVEPK